MLKTDGTSSCSGCLIAAGCPLQATLHNGETLGQAIEQLCKRRQPVRSSGSNRAEAQVCMYKRRLGARRNVRGQLVTPATPPGKPRASILHVTIHPIHSMYGAFQETRRMYFSPFLTDQLQCSVNKRRCDSQMQPLAAAAGLPEETLPLPSSGRQLVPISPFNRSIQPGGSAGSSSATPAGNENRCVQTAGERGTTNDRVPPIHQLSSRHT